MPHNITGTNTFTNPVPALSDGDPVAQASSDPTTQALANRDVNLDTRLAILEAQTLDARIDTIELYVLRPGLKAKTSGNGSTTIDGFIQGTWTPAMAADGTNAVTNTSQNGRFMRIGEWVYAIGYTEGSVGASTGNFYLGGLPYSIAGLSGLTLVGHGYNNSTPSGNWDRGVKFIYGGTTLLAARANRFEGDTTVATAIGGGGAAWNTSDSYFMSINLAYRTTDAF